MKSLVALLITILLSMGAFADDETDFATVPPVSWTRFNPLGIASFDFTGGKARLSSPAPAPSLYPVYGPARLALFGPTTFTQTAVSADIVAWGPTRNVPGVIARANNIGLGATRGYSFGVIPSSGEVAIHRVTGEFPTPISLVKFITLTPGHSYRVILICAGSNLVGRIFDLADLATPLITLSVTDATYTSGVTGILNAADSLTAIDVSFANFLAWDGTPPPLSVISGANAMIIRSNVARSLGTILETTDDLELGFYRDFSASTINGVWLETSVPTTGSRQFYRRRLMGTE